MRNKSCGNGSKNSVFFRYIMRNGIAIGNPNIDIGRQIEQAEGQTDRWKNRQTEKQRVLWKRTNEMKFMSGNKPRRRMLWKLNNGHMYVYSRRRTVDGHLKREEKDGGTECLRLVEYMFNCVNSIIWYYQPQKPK